MADNLSFGGKKPKTQIFLSKAVLL